MSIIGHDTLTHLIEYPAASGRFYHRRPDGSVLRVETRLLDGSWFDITCDTVEVSIQWGDITGTDLTPTSDSGQAQIILRDIDGRYGPIPPAGFPLHLRWRPVRVWTGFVGDPTHMPVDESTDFGEPGDYGSTPPQFYGGHLRTVTRDGIVCRFSGWILTQERNPLDDVTTTWTCGDGMVRLVDQTVPDFDNKLDAEQPDGMRDGAPGNYRVQTLISYVHDPAGAPYPTVVDSYATKPMMRSPEGKVADLVRAVAQADLAFFWWQPNVAPSDHDVIGDYFEYRDMAQLTTRGIDWPVQCDRVELTGIDEVSDDSNFYSAVRAAKGVIARSVPITQPPWTGAAFDTEFRKVAFQQWKVQPGETYQFKLQCSPRVAKLGFQWRVRFPATSLEWSDCGQQTMTDDPTTDSQTVQSKQVVVDAAAPDDTLMEILVDGKGLAPITVAGTLLADNVTLFVVRQHSTGPEAVVDDPTLADTAEVHEYERKDLMLRYQTDVAAWADWIVNRSSTIRYTLTNVATQPDVGNPNWSWAMWHGARLGDRVTIAMEDGYDPTVTQWLRGLEMRIADSLTMTLHLEAIIGGVTRRPHPGVTLVTKPQPLPPGSTPFPGGAFLPGYASPPELPDWSFNQAGNSLGISSTGDLVWAEGEDVWPIRTAEPPNLRVELNRTYPDEIRFYLEGPTEPFGGQAGEPFGGNDSYSSRIRQWPWSFGALEIETASFSNNPYSGTPAGNRGDFYITVDEFTLETDCEFADDDPYYPFDNAFTFLTGNADGYRVSAEFGATGNGSADCGFEARYIAPAPDGARGPYAVMRAVNVDASAVTELEVAVDIIRVNGAPFGATSDTRWTPVGQVQVLVSADVDVTAVQLQHQIGQAAVVFSAGVGTITVPVPMGVTRVVHAQVVGTTVGGPMVAQVTSVTSGNTIDVYLDRTHSGTLAVDWSVDHDVAPVVLAAGTTVDRPERRLHGQARRDAVAARHENRRNRARRP